MSSLLRRWQTETGDTYVLSLVRVILGGLLLVSAPAEVFGIVDGPYFGEFFHVPILPEWLVPSRPMAIALLVLQIVLALLVIAGRLARPSLLASAAVGGYFLLCDRISYHNNRYALLLVVFLFAFAPCDRAFVLGKSALPPSERVGPLWAQRLAQLQLSIVYLASGGSKLLDPDWRDGLVLGDRMIRATSLAVSKGAPAALMEILTQPEIASALSKIAIATELFLAVALFLPRTRFFALWWGMMFHATIEITSYVMVFGWLSMSIYMLFCQPELRERVVAYDPARPAGVLVARVCRWLDWLARFEVRADPRATLGQAFAVRDRDGSWGAGLAGWARIARGIPILFPLSIPLFVLAGLGGKAHLQAEST